GLAIRFREVDRHRVVGRAREQRGTLLGVDHVVRGSCDVIERADDIEVVVGREDRADVCHRAGNLTASMVGPVVILLQSERMEAAPRSDEELREQAIHQLKKKRDFRTHLFIYFLVNAMLIVIWAATGAGFFWPVFVILGWGIGIAANAWDVYG